MKLVEINFQPSKKDLRIFGLLLGVFTLLLATIFWWRELPAISQMIGWVGGIATLLYWVIPPLQRFVFIGLCLLTFPIGFVVSHVILFLIYYLMFFPIGMLLRIAGYDAMKRRWEPNRNSYWEEHSEPRNSKQYFKQH